MVAICRLCASLKSIENMTFIRDDNHDVCRKLFKCCQLNIDLEDGLPKSVCPECVRSLNTSFEFYERVHESLQTFEKLRNMNVSTSKVTEIIVDDEKSSKERISLAMMATTAKIENDKSADEPSTEINEIQDAVNEAVVTSDNENSNDVTRVINEILGVKDESCSYLSLESVHEKVDDDMSASVESVILTGSYAGIEFIEEEDGEEIDFERNHYEIIEEDEEVDDDSPSHEQTQNELQAIEDNVVFEEECAKPSTSLPPITETWTDYTWKCVRCSETSCTSKELLEHNESVHRGCNTSMEWLCSDCQKTFPRYYMLVNHIRQRHRAHLALFCDVCNERCSSFNELEEHRQIEHKCEENLVMLICVTCGKGFNTTNSLQIHGKCHLPDDLRLRYPCDLCDKKFRTSSNLKFHQKMHSGTRDYVCDQCGKNFIQRANLEEHLVTHITFTPYECSQCNKFFKTPERLTRHKQRHTDDKPFVCTECEKTFRTKDAMATHMRIHTGEMPFSCEFCQKPFRFRSTLMTHHNVHTGTRPYSCTDCNHHFTNWPNYNKHMKRRHGIDVSSKNPRGKKPANPAKPLKQPTSTTTTRRKSNIVNREAVQDIRFEEEVEDGIITEYEPDEDINITVPKEEKENPDDNYEDAIC